VTTPNALSAVDRLVFPLDVHDLDDARTWIRRMAGEVGVFKVGLELFTAVGPDAVRAVHDAGALCFLDLKLHDIPATMAGAVRSAASLGVAYLTIHTSAGPVAMKACVDAAGAVRTMRGPTTLLGVTVLTSMDAAELASLGVAGTPADAVSRLAGLATTSGLSGLVCSPHECAALRDALGRDVKLVVPGIRPSGADLGDQKRAASPALAIREGADLLVVGRPIRDAKDPVEAARAVVAEIARALRDKSSDATA
jgi:orotidine-5'-phosphate decarboxylase